MTGQENASRWMKEEPYELAMMCWESLDSEQASKKRKTPGHGEETNDDKEIQADEMDDKTHIKSTVNTGNQQISLLMN